MSEISSHRRWRTGMVADLQPTKLSTNQHFCLERSSRIKPTPIPQSGVCPVKQASQEFRNLRSPGCFYHRFCSGCGTVWLMKFAFPLHTAWLCCPPQPFFGVFTHKLGIVCRGPCTTTTSYNDIFIHPPPFVRVDSATPDIF